jgi:hypothetical protein
MSKSAHDSVTTARRRRITEKQTDHYVYVIASRIAVKIGISADPRKRLNNLQVSSPYRLSLASAYAVPKTRARRVEALIHRRLNYCRKVGEWFDICVRDAESVVSATVREVYFFGPKGRPAHALPR